MSISPSNLLHRLAELKNWQQNQEKKFKNSNTNVSSNSEYQTIEGLSAFDTTLEDEGPPKIVDLENKVISPTKTFSQLLEEKLAEDPGPVAVPQKPKKPFLRKGTGLERYKIKVPLSNVVKKSISKSNVNKKSEHFTPLRAPDFSIKPKATWCKVTDDQAESPVKKINQLVQMSEPGDQTLYEKALEKELLIFEALEQKAEDSSFSSTNSSVVRILASSPIKKPPPPPIIEEKRVHWESQSDDDIIESQLTRPDIEKILQSLQKFAQNKSKPRPPEISDDEKWTSTETSSSETSVSSTDLEVTLTTKRDVAVGTDNVEACTDCCDKLKEKISTYNEKIKEVIEDKDKVTQIKKELEKKRDLLEKEFDRKIKAIEDEKRAIFFELEAEKKKLEKEKVVYQSFLKDSQNRPTKKEREEISNLKQEVADLKETLKLKESKNGLTQARLRNQIKQLEKESLNLKEQVEKLTKENAKLTASQKLSRKHSETKILHEINKNVNKLAQETLKNQKTIEINNSDDHKSKTPPTNKNNKNNEDDSLLEITNFRNTSHVDLEKQYERMFRGDLQQNMTLNETNKNDKTEVILDDGGREITYTNGNVKTITPDGNFITMKYYNGDIKQTLLLEGVVKYFYFNKNIWQTTYSDGSELIEFPDGIKEKRYRDGKCEITLPDGIYQIIHPDGTQEVRYPDSSLLTMKKSGEKILLLPNGQKEIDTKEHKRREYPDGTVKILYPDGTQETRYASGRIRIRDGSGALILDSQP